MNDSEFKRILGLLPKIAEAVNQFDSAEIQKEVFNLLMKAVDLEREIGFLPKKETLGDRKTKAIKNIVENDDELDLVKVANFITDNEDYNSIDTNILKKTDQLSRIMMCLYYSHKIGCDYLSTGQIEKITDQLGIKILMTNATKALTKNKGFFSTNKARKKGAKIGYKLNKKGTERFEEILKGVKKQ